MFYRVGSTASATMVFSAIATARRNWSGAANFSAWPDKSKFLCSYESGGLSRSIRETHWPFFAGMPRLPSRPHDYDPGSAARAFFANHQGHIMIHPARLQFGPLRNSKPSSQQNRLDSRSPESLTSSRVSHILPCDGPLNSPYRDPPASFQHLPAACSLFDDSDSPSKTHTSDTKQRFSPIHF